MNQLLSGLLAVVMAFTGICGALLQTRGEEPITLELSVEEIQGDLSSLPLSDSIATFLPVLPDLLQAVALRLSGASDAAQAQVLINGRGLAAFSARQQEDGWAFVSDLFPATVLTVKQETLSSFTSLLPASLTNVLQAAVTSLSALDAALMAEASAPVEEALVALIESAGKPVSGSFKIGGVTFKQKIPYNLTTKKLLDLSVDTWRKILSGKKASSLLAAISPKLTPAAVMEIVESMLAGYESELPVFTAARYTGDEKDYALEISLEKDSRKMALQFVVTGETQVFARLNVLDQYVATLEVDLEHHTENLEVMAVQHGVPYFLKTDYVQDEECGETRLNAVLSGGGMIISVDAHLIALESGGNDLRVKVTFPAQGKVFSLTLGAKLRWQRPAITVRESLNHVALEDLISDEAAQAALRTEVDKALATLKIKVGLLFPQILKALPNPLGTK